MKIKNFEWLSLGAMSLILLLSFVRTLLSGTIEKDAFHLIQLGAGVLIIVILIHFSDLLVGKLGTTTTFLIHIFIVLSIGGGNGFSLYSRFIYFDSVLHLFSGYVIADIGYKLTDKTWPVLSRVAFAVCFATTLGVFWEIYEFTGDHLFDLNMQRYQGLVGQAALFDTMKDFICNLAGAGIAAVVLFVTQSNHVKHLNPQHHQPVPAKIEKRVKLKIGNW